MSIFTYNGVQLPYAFHTDFRQEAVFDESQTDWIGTAFDISVQAVLNADFAGAGYSNAADYMKQIRADLMRPRRTLSVSIGGVQLIPEGSSVDTKNGPQPKYCTIHNLTNNTFLINYRIHAQYWESPNNPGFSRVGSPVLYNRWSDMVEYDIAGYATRTREGKFLIRSDGGKQPDALRTQFAVTGLQNGYIRVQSSYRVTPDGLGLEYRLMDKQQFRMPPSPAWEASGYYRETSPHRGQAIRYGEVFVRLKGGSLTTQSELVRVATGIAGTKLARAGALGGGSKGPTEFSSVTAGMYENTVEVHQKAFYNPPTNALANSAMSRPQIIAEVVGSSAFDPPSPYSPSGTGFASPLLQAAAYYDPSLAGNKLNQTTNQMNNGSPPGGGR